jgi:adenylate cyclase
MTVDMIAEPMGFGTSGLKNRQEVRIAESLAAEEAAGRLLALKGRTIALTAVGVLLFLLVPFPGVLFYEAFLALFIVAGFGRHWVERLGLHRWWQGYVQVAVDFALLAFLLVAPNPWAEIELPPQMSLRMGNFVYFYLLLVGLAFGYQARQVIWGGIVGAAAWIVAVAWVATRPDTVFATPADHADHTAESMIATFAMPTFVDLDSVVQDVVVFLIVSGLLALVVSRSRQSVLRQATLERERGNLARYFPPATVDRLAVQDTALAQVREQDAAVLFADLVGFTHWAERHAAHEVIALLREVHAQLEETVFRHHGTLDKFIGDGMMATFGTPDPSPRDATNALGCLRDLVDRFDVWNTRRILKGKETIRIALGLHYGPVVVGNIGTDRRLEFGVLGDVVNVASRLETLTRELGVVAAISSSVAEAVVNESTGEEARLLAGFADQGPIALKGRAEKVMVLTYGSVTASLPQNFQP